MGHQRSTWLDYRNATLELVIFHSITFAHVSNFGGGQSFYRAFY
jgi:hypothetical protein